MAENINVWEAIRRRPVLAALPLLVFVAAGIGFGLQRHPVYTATSRLYVQVPSVDPAALFGVTDAAAGLASTYSRAADATAVVAAVQRRLSGNAAAASGSASATPVPSSPVVKVTAQASTSTAAVLRANVTASELGRYINRLNASSSAANSAIDTFRVETQRVTAARARVKELQDAVAISPTTEAKAQLEQARADLDVELLRRDAARARFSTVQGEQQPSLEPLQLATGATNDRRSKLELFGFAGLIAGAVSGCALALLRNSLDTQVRSGEEVAHELGLPLLTRIPAPPRGVIRRRRLMMLERPEGSHAEALRLLRANLEFARREAGVKVVMLVSAVGAEGKTATAANLGVSLARLGERVVVVDLDLRRPRLAHYFGLPPDVGLSDVVVGRSSIAAAISHVSLNGASPWGAAARNGAGLDVLPAGRLPPNPGDFAGSPELPALFDELRRDYSFVLVDTPAALETGDAIALSRLADGLLIVAKPASLSRPGIRELHRLLDASPARKLGIVAVA